MVRLYLHNYARVLKENFMLVIVASALLIFTYFIWAGVPYFIIGNAVFELTSNLAVSHLFTSIAVGLLFSFFFIPINLKVAKNVAELKHRSVLNCFIRIEIIWIIICALLFETVLIVTPF